MWPILPISGQNTVRATRWTASQIAVLAQLRVKDLQITITILDNVHRPISCLKLDVSYKCSIGLSVVHRKHITSPLRAQHVNATSIYTRMLGTMVY
jgi:hypothetical protein